MLPLLTILLLPPPTRVPVTFFAVLIALAITGWVSARLGGANPERAVGRVVVGGALAMAITYLIGHLFGGIVA
jgi:VIT1/CCC1 family predicted Fe2+/Mn2+ transporter